MNIESLRKHLAIKVMGWKLKEHIRTKGTYDYWDKNDNHVMRDIMWNPTENIKQVMECFDAIATEKIGWSLYLNCKPQQHVCEIYEWTHNGTEKTRLGVEVNHKKELAASIALAKATGWKE